MAGVDGSFAKTPKKKKKKKKSAISIAKPSSFKPTFTGARGTAKYYFFPNKIGARWTLRTIRHVLDQGGKISRADTVYQQSVVIDSARMSLERLPLMVTSDTSFNVSTSEGARSESIYYVDDSIAMTVFNNGVTNGENRFLLIAPLTVGSSWPEKQGDSVRAIIGGIADSLIMQYGGKIEHVLITVTQLGNSDFRKFYAPGIGIIKMIYRSPGPSGRGLVIVTTEMTAFKLPEQKKEKTD